VRRLIKLDESGSSNLTKAAHQTWREKRHLIKSDENLTSSNFWEGRQSFYFLMSNSAATLDVRNLALQKIIFCVKTAVISERS
jgi:hypothetical protein